MVARRAEVRGASVTAALLALLLLSFASVQSIVMQATIPASVEISPICGHADPATAMAVAMTLMRADQASAASSHDHRSGLPHPHRAACPYCAAAGHAPILGSVIGVRHSTNCIFTAFRTAASLGPRGPPAAQPRARGPPSYPLTA
jgi:hypothetical protein